PDGRAGKAASAVAPDAHAGSRRVVRALLFGDVKGFSRLTDEQLPRFTEHVLGAFAGVLGRYEDAIGHRNTWGDALYVVLTDATTTAACAHDLQRAMESLDLESL